MYDVNETWSSPWLDLQKNLASGFGIEGSSQDIAIREPQGQGRMASSNSWLVRARSRAQFSRIIQ